MTNTQQNSARHRKAGFPKGRQVDDNAFAEIKALLAGTGVGREYLIETLHLIQDKYGHLSLARLVALAKFTNIPQSEIFEVASFYHHFDIVGEEDTPPPAITIRVCDSLSCEMAGANSLILEMEKEAGAAFRVVRAPCVGACDRAPAAIAGKRRIDGATNQKIKSAIETGNLEAVVPDYPNLASYQSDGGYHQLAECRANNRNRDSVILEIENAGLKGMGGAGFPTARKWKFLSDTPKPRVLVVNADEGEPGTFKDRQCLENTPHTVLEGALIAAWAIEAEDIYIYLRDEYPQIREILTREIAEIDRNGVSAGVKIHLRRGAGAYICGEEGALLESLEGKRGLPRNRPPYPAEKGLFGRPTLINNVETLYWVAEILKNGADWYISEGRPRFYSVSGRVRGPGVYLAPSNITVRQLIDDYCGGMADGHEFAAYFPGGASGGVLPARLGDLPLEFGALDEYGCFVGSAAVIVLSDKDPVIEAVQNILRFFADESCGQCTPCRLGCERLVEMLKREKFPNELAKELMATMRDASICGLGQAAPNPVSAALRFFEEEFA